MNPAIIAAGASAAGGLLSNITTGLFNANQSAINRSFQREMYQRQYDDAIKFWQMQNEYNLPSAQVQRIKDSGLNAALLYSNGAPQNVATAAPAQPQKPSGAQTSAAFSNPLDLAQYALLDAQREKMAAETDKLKSETDWQKIENQFSRDTFNVRYAIQHKNLEMLEVSMEEMRNNICNSSRITNEQVRTMIQGREYEIKRFNLDESYRGSMIQQGWSHLANEKQQVAQGWRKLSLEWLGLQNMIKMTNAQIGALQWSVLKDKAMFGLEFEGLSLDNKLKRWDTHLRRAKLTETQLNNANIGLKNYYLQNTGAEQITNVMTQGPQFLWQGAYKPTLQDLLYIPKLK